MSRLSEVAQHVGVSEATVSRVLNGKPGVSESTRIAVLTALDVLGYERPTQMRGERSRLVGLVVPELRNPVYPVFAEVIGVGLAKHGVTPVLCTTTFGGTSEPECVSMLLDRQVSGMIFVCGRHATTKEDHRHYHRLMDRGLPVVAVNGVTSDLKLPAVSADDFTAVDRAVHYLASLGHRRIGLMAGDDGHEAARRKVAAFGEVMRRHCDAGDTALAVERSLYSLEGGQAAGARLFERGMTAVVCGSDLMALGAIRAARRLGLSVPGDVSVVGFDDSAFMTLVDPPLTTIRQPVESMGRAVVDLLMQQIAGGHVPPEEILFETELVLRGSTGSAPRTSVPA
ncbi:MAG: LacI family DNA-binding transcriptional regulator [Actinobacteria bacterium]|nr:LacI family DNA-binding transcriptional regulator [Actinomycetota bacterium]